MYYFLGFYSNNYDLLKVQQNDIQPAIKKKGIQAWPTPKPPAMVKKMGKFKRCKTSVFFRQTAAFQIQGFSQLLRKGAIHENGCTIETRFKRWLRCLDSQGDKIVLVE